MDAPKSTSAHPLRGYPFLAKFFAKTQSGMARKFNTLATLNILYLQAEICHIESDLKRERQKDLESGEERRADCDWNWLLLSSPELNRGSKQWELVLELRRTLDMYYSALLQYSEISKLREPTERQRKHIFKILGSASLTNDGLGQFQSRDLAGLDGPMMYRGEFAGDLILLDAMEEDNDCLSRWIVHPLFDLVHLVWKGKKRPLSGDLEGRSGGESPIRVYNYSSHHVAAVNHVVGALFAAVLPLTSMVILYRISDMNVKVALVCVFTILFCLAMSAFSKARRIEVFGATAAFGSVQVVWISQNNCTPAQ